MRVLMSVNTKVHLRVDEYHAKATKGRYDLSLA